MFCCGDWKSRRRGEKAVPLARAGEFVRGLRAAVVLGERGPGEGDHVAARRQVLRRAHHVRNHRAVARDADAQFFGFRALHQDGLVDRLERARALRRDVAAGASSFSM
jgi:hypothetical protein